MTGVQLSLLSPLELSRLAELETVIERGLATFVEVGLALAEIRDSRLYRDTHATFEAYLDERWSISRQHGYRLIEGAQVAELVSPMGDIPNERQARELVPLLADEAELVETYRELRAEHGDGLTADKVRAAVDERLRRDRVLEHFGSSASDEWETPRALFEHLNAEFGFELDVCALPATAKCERYFTPADDGLAQDWRGVCWMNPPYGATIGDWMCKAWESAQAGATVVCLVPARVDTDWWWTYSLRGEIRFIRGRVQFANGASGAPFPSAIVVLGRPARTVWWEAWRP